MGAVWETSLDDTYQRMPRVLQLIGGLHKHNVTNHLQPGMAKEHLSPRPEAVHKENGSPVCCYEELPLKVAVSIAYIMDDINLKNKKTKHIFILYKSSHDLTHPICYFHGPRMKQCVAYPS